MSQIVVYISILLYILTRNKNRNRNMPRSRGGRLVSEIGTGGHEGRNILGMKTRIGGPLKYHSIPPKQSHQQSNQNLN